MYFYSIVMYYDQVKMYNFLPVMLPLTSLGGSFHSAYSEVSDCIFTRVIFFICMKTVNHNLLSFAKNGMKTYIS